MLATHGLSLEDWGLGGGLRVRGGPRPLHAPISDVAAACDDGLLLRFTPPPGAYATNVIREIMKNR